MGGGLPSWQDVVQLPTVSNTPAQQQQLLNLINGIGALGNTYPGLNVSGNAHFQRLLQHCPCLYAQLNVKATGRAVVHLCEVTLGARIDSTNAQQAFIIQHPTKNAHTFAYPPVHPGAGVGEITEELCSEVLTNSGVPHMQLDKQGWPDWDPTSHVSLNRGKFSRMKTYGDILIPAAPTNVLISVKTEKARERLMVSGNRFESIGFGFFDQPSEFWGKDKINLYKRMGFTAIYMPQVTLLAVVLRMTKNHIPNTNINGTDLYRSLQVFGDDMRRIAGKISLEL